MKATIKAFMITSSLIGAAFSSQAQTNPQKVSGLVNQADNKPVEFATVTILKASDSSLVKGAVADIAGKYEFESVKQGKYIIAATFVGMNKVYSNSFEVKNASVAMPSITLVANTKSLKAVDVTARRPFIEQKVDKLVVNVESSIATSGGTALEALEKSPNLTVDKDGNISMKGKSGVLILIDGKQTSMSAQDIAELLRSMPATNLDQIELMSNPSSKYDAAGNAGIINLKLKKNTNFGTNGSVNLGVAQGVRPRYNAGLNLNNRSAKVNVFGSYNFSHREQQSDLYIYRSIKDVKGTQIFDQTGFNHQRSDYNGGKVGVDYSINKRNTIGVMVDLAMREADRPNIGKTKIGYAGLVDSILNTNSANTDSWKRGAYNINYRGILDSTGKELNIDLDYAKNTDRANSFITALTNDPASQKVFNSDTSRNLQPSTITIRTGKIDYSQPFTKQGKLELGAKVSFVTSDNDARFDSLRIANWIPDTSRSNHFIYKENVNAAYVNFNKQYKAFQVQVGLRAEQTNVTGESSSLKKSQEGVVKNDTSYFNLFPSAAISYKADKNNTFGVTYSRRIQRPSYEDLNPFEFYLDRYTMVSGNPYLRPQYSNNFELSHTFKQFLITTLGYSHTKDNLMRILEAEKDPATGDTTIVRYKYMNVAKSDKVNLSISAPLPITKWWNSFTTMSFNYNVVQANVNDNTVKLDAFSYFGRTQQTFTISKNTTAELVFMYISPQITDNELFKMKSMMSVDLGLQQKVLNGKGTLKLNVTDIFKTMYARGEFSNVGMTTNLRSYWDAQQARLSFAYRFGNSNVKAARARQTGLTDEQGRVKNGGN
ncbi:outer membrane beta-barrel family protein [Chitinophaga sp. Cy-1792]|uniref:outer membrane beta-barrel family protein n=1 Tax=Chitinophaga sp. Cy-1792 TaxID=2608339 RepID=UPI00141EDFBC|nr:outer membrane beta-barrel family protein [Chitinophaga sp. Cy-1792]NIG57711.1 TonB-dependent receptor [Chitinophaga sp. Cy-1792]